MNGIFIYYSLTGSGDVVAERMKEKGYEVRKVISARRLPKKFFFRVLSGGFLAGLGAKDKLKDFDENIADFDEIVIGSPVWNGRFSTPINAVLDKLDLNNKKLRFVLYSGSGEAPKALKKISACYPQAVTTVLKEPKDHPDELVKI
ncbi:MAG: NAD(P)H-dependent oxidoreductase [Clostridia bacterium]|nr:NAD(P)H-dependent oxidoreductase [Clostridia bacterium]